MKLYIEKKSIVTPHPMGINYSYYIITIDVSYAKRYYFYMIKSFRSNETEKIWNGIVSKKLPKDIQQIARRKLRMLNNSKTLDDLRIPPGNKLEKLKGSREEQYSIRINDQWRICFEFREGNCYNVEITDYH